MGEEGGAWREPSLEVAQAYARAQRPLKNVAHGVDEEYGVYSTTLLELGELGGGIRMYFTALRTFGRLFASLALTCFAVNVALMVLQSFDPVSQGQGLTQVQTLARGSVAMLAETLPYTDSNATSLHFYTVGDVPPVSQFDKRAATVVTCTLDVFAMLVILGSVARFALIQRRLAKADEEDMSTIGAFSVEVWGLPADATDTRELMDHFSSVLDKDAVGGVAQVYVGRAYGDFLTLREKQAALALEAEVAEARARKLGLDPTEACAKVAAKLEHAHAQVAAVDDTRLPCVCAYITLDSEAGRLALERMYRGGPLHRCTQRRQLRFRGKHALRVRRAAEPTNIVWGNLQYTAASRTARRLFTAAVTFVLLLITTGFVIGATVYEKSIPPAVDCAATARAGRLPCTALFPLNGTHSNSDPVRRQVSALADGVTAADCVAHVDSSSNTWQTNYTTFWNVSAAAPLATATADPTNALQCAAGTCLRCFCHDRGVIAYARNTDGLRSYCQPYWENLALSWTLKGVSIGSVLVVNQLLVGVMKALTAFERLQTNSQVALSEAIKLFVSQFINTLVVTLAVYADISRLDRIPLIFHGAFTDFLPGWYASVGSSLFLTVFTQAVVPLALRSVGRWADHVVTAVRSRFAYTQHQLDKLMLGPRFELAERTASVLNLIFLALALCGGLPGVMIVLAGFFLACYWSDKWFLLKVARAPAAFDGTVIQRFNEVLVWAVWTHAALTAWMYGALPSYEIDVLELLGRDRSEQVGDGGGQFDLRSRLRKVTFLMQASLLVAVTLVQLARAYADRVRELLAACAACCCSARMTARVSTFAPTLTFAQLVMADRLLGLNTYDIRANPEFQDAFSELTGFRVTSMKAYASEQPGAEEAHAGAPGDASAAAGGGAGDGYENVYAPASTPPKPPTGDVEDGMARKPAPLQ